jgi:signal transduction histidine kinase/AmiR/NasT family two-component response regulator
MDEAAWESLVAESPHGRALATFEQPGGTVLEVRLTALAGESGAGYLVLLQDVTEVVRAAEVRDAAVRRAEEASRVKDEFIAMVSHELRTPMTAILGWSRMMRAGRVPDAKKLHALDVIERNAAAQAKLIEDLLDISRITGGKMKLDVQPTSMQRVVAQAVDSMRFAAEAKGIALTVDVEADLPDVLADADRIGQVLRNLVGNAVKFTHREGTVRTSVRLAESAVELVVSDNGEGIEPDALPYIFDAFRQAESGSKRRQGGLGLGLAIARRLMELHGGSVSATSAGRGFGATFTARLPIQALRATCEGGAVESVARAAIDESAMSDALRGVRVLVVEDDNDSRNLVGAVLEAAGAEVDEAESAAHALERIRAKRYDVVISDIGMPVEDGYALVAKLRSDVARPGKRLVLIAFTALARHADRDRALQAGFDAHATKPIDPTALVSLVERELAIAGKASSTMRSA